MRTKKKHLPKNKEVKEKDYSSKKRRKTAKKRLEEVGGDGFLNSIKENTISGVKNAANIAANPLTSLRKGANYAKNKGKFALTYLVNTSDLDRMIYKNSNFIHLVPTEKLNDIYYENEVKTGDSEIVYAAKKTKEAIGKLGTNVKDAAVVVANKTKETLEKLNPINETTIAAAKSAAKAAVMGAVAVGEVAKIAKDKGKEALKSIWSTINQPITEGVSKGDGKYETTFGEVGSKFGRKLDTMALSLDFDQPGLTKPAIKKRTKITANYAPSNIYKDVLVESLASEEVYDNATIFDIASNNLTELDEYLGLLQKTASASNKRKRKKGKGKGPEKQQKVMIIENEIAKEQKFEISKALLEILYEIIPPSKSESESDNKNILIFLNGDHLNNKKFLENVGSPSKFVQKNIEYSKDGVEGGSNRRNNTHLGGEGSNRRNNTHLTVNKKKKNKKQKKQKGGTLKVNGETITNISALFEDPPDNNNCIVADGTNVKFILADLATKENPKAFSLLFFDIEVYESQNNVTDNMSNITSILKENGIIVGDPGFEKFGDWKKMGTFKLKGFDEIYGIFVKSREHFLPVTGIDRVEPVVEVVEEEVVDEGKDVNGEVDGNGNGVKDVNGNGEVNLDEQKVPNKIVDQISKTAVLILKDVLEKNKVLQVKDNSQVEDNSQVNKKLEKGNTITNTKNTKNVVPELNLKQINSETTDASETPSNTSNKTIHTKVPVEITTEAIKVGGTNEKVGLEIPLSLIKYISELESESESKSKEKNKQIRSSSIGPKGNLLLQNMILPQIIKKRIENNQRFLDILDEIIQPIFCKNLKDNETKTTCFTEKVKTLSSSLNLGIMEPEPKPKSKYNNNELFQSYNKSTARSSSDTSNATSNTIQEWFQDVRSSLKSIITEIGTSSNDSVDILESKSDISSLTMGSDFTTVTTNYFENVKNQNTFLEEIDKIHKQIKEKREQLQEIQKINNEKIEEIQNIMNPINISRKEKGKADTIVKIPTDNKNKPKMTKVSANFKSIYNGIDINVKNTKNKLNNVKVGLDTLFNDSEKKSKKTLPDFSLIDNKSSKTKSNLTMKNVEKIPYISNQNKNQNISQDISQEENKKETQSNKGTEPESYRSDTSNSNNTIDLNRPYSATSSTSISSDDISSDSDFSSIQEEVEYIVDNVIISEMDVLLEIVSNSSTSSNNSTDRSIISEGPINTTRFTSVGPGP